MKIRADVPIPKPRAARTAAGNAARVMAAGESVFVTELNEMHAVRWALYKQGGKPSTRKCVEDGVNGWRIWRTK